MAPSNAQAWRKKFLANWTNGNFAAFAQASSGLIFEPNVCWTQFYTQHTVAAMNDGVRSAPPISSLATEHTLPKVEHLMNQLPTSKYPSPPAIWSPNAAANWSLLFTPSFGAFIHARNAESLGRSDEAKANRKWFYGNLIFLGIVLLSTLTPNVSDAPFRLVGLVILLVWYFALAKKQAKYVKDTFGGNYQKKTWGKPLLIAFVCFVGFMLLAWALAFVAELINGTKAA